MIQVVDYHASWPRRFEALRDEYSAALAQADVIVEGSLSLKNHLRLRDGRT